MKYVRITADDIIRSNLIVTAPTGSGKTTSTVHALGKALQAGRFKKAFYTVPTLALAREVYRKLVEAYGPHNVGIITSDAKLEPGWTPREYEKPIVVGTYEAVDTILLDNPDALDNAILVIDEVHTMLDPQRGTTINSMLATAKYAASHGARVRVILLSATIPEVDRLAEYLGAKVIAAEERPVELTYIVRTPQVDTIPLGRGFRNMYALTKLMELTKYLQEVEGKLDRAIEELGGSVNVPPDAPLYERFKAKVQKLKELVEERGENAPEHVRELLDMFPILVFVPNVRIIEYYSSRLGIPVHHRGVPLAQRKKLEEALRRDIAEVPLVLATHTLALGVNMKFGTVVVPILKVWTKDGVRDLRPDELVQVGGRAGRPGKKRGWVVVIPLSGELYIVEQAKAKRYKEIPPPSDYPGLALRLVLTGRRPELLARYGFKINRERLLEAITALESVGLIRREGERYKPTEFALALSERYVTSEVLIPVLTVYSLDPDAYQHAEDGILWGRGDHVEKVLYYGAAIAWFTTGYTIERAVLKADLYTVKDPTLLKYERPFHSSPLATPPSSVMELANAAGYSSDTEEVLPTPATLIAFEHVNELPVDPFLESLYNGFMVVAALAKRERAHPKFVVKNPIYGPKYVETARLLAYASRLTRAGLRAGFKLGGKPFIYTLKHIDRLLLVSNAIKDHRALAMALAAVEPELELLAQLYLPKRRERGRRRREHEHGERRRHHMNRA